MSPSNFCFAWKKKEICHHLCTNYAVPIFPNHRPVRSLQEWGLFFQTPLCTLKPRGLGPLVASPLTNSHMACTHSQEDTCPNPTAKGWGTPGTLASLCLVTLAHHHPTHPWLVMEEHLRPCQRTHRCLHPIHPCQDMEEASLEEVPCL